MAQDCVCDPLHKIPWEILTQMKWLAWNASWHAANHFVGYNDDAKKDIARAADHEKKFLEFGLPKEDCAMLFKKMAWAAAWSTANERFGNREDRDSNKATVHQCQQEMVKTGEVTEGLAHDLAEMCWGAAWHTANTRKCYRKDAAKDKERFEHYFQQCGGDCCLVAIDFIQSRAVLMNPETPKFFADQKLENQSDMEQEMSVKFSHWTTKTDSWSTSVKWKFSVAAAIAGLYFVAGGVGVSLSYSKETTHGGSITDGEKKEHEFKVKVGPRQVIVAKGIVQECKCKCPYFMVFDIGGKRYCKEGIWSGIVAANVEYKVGETVYLDCVN